VEDNTSKILVRTPDPTNGAPAGGGSALFVINLCASIAPVPTTGKNLPGLDNYRLYQVARVEDGRTRHRLRLGFFTSESHAQSVLTVVRQQYPTAFTACLCDEDRRFARGFLPESAPSAAPKRPMSVVPTPAPAPARAPASVPPVAATATSTPAKPAATPAPAAAQKPPAPAASKSLTPARPEVIELTWEPERTPAAAATAPVPRSPAALNEDAGLDEFTWEPPSLQAPAASTSDTAKHPVLSPGYKTQPVMKAAPAKAAPPAKSAPAVAKPAVAKPAAEIKPVAVAPKAPAKTDTGASMKVRALELSLSEPPPPPRATASQPSTKPFHVGKGVEIDDLDISLQAEAPKASAAAPAAPAASKVAAASTPATAAPAKSAQTKSTPAAKTPAAKTPAPAGAKAPVTPKATPPAAPIASPPIAATAKPALPVPVRQLMGTHPDLDSTQTIRALTSDEMNDAAQEKWFAIQLAASEQPVNLDTMPHLDIFEAYRLYSVATAGSGKIIHSLRLGFFKEAVSAEAVSGYLKTFFGSPSVLRVSVAEHARFKDPPTLKKADAPKAEAKVVELNNARAARPVVPTVTVEVAPRPQLDTSATGSFNPNATGSFRTSATGTHKSLKPAAKSAGATKRSKALSSTSSSGKHKALVKKSLSEELLDEAREVALDESGIRRLPKNDSLLSRLVGKLTK
jgi:hypothetical protein